MSPVSPVTAEQAQTHSHSPGSESGEKTSVFSARTGNKCADYGVSDTGTKGSAFVSSMGEQVGSPGPISVLMSC